MPHFNIKYLAVTVNKLTWYTAFTEKLASRDISIATLILIHKFHSQQGTNWNIPSSRFASSCVTRRLSLQFLECNANVTFLYNCNSFVACAFKTWEVIVILSNNGDQGMVHACGKKKKDLNKIMIAQLPCTKKLS